MASPLDPLVFQHPMDSRMSVETIPNQSNSYLDNCPATYFDSTYLLPRTAGRDSFDIWAFLAFRSQRNLGRENMENVKKAGGDLEAFSKRRDDTVFHDDREFEKQTLANRSNGHDDYRNN